ncbi:MAG: hypothetical protein ABUL62_30120 [Myxococcales bacterium]
MRRAFLTLLGSLALSGCCRCRTAEGATPSTAFVAPMYARGSFTVGVRDGHAWFFAPDGALPVAGLTWALGAAYAGAVLRVLPRVQR